jgi:hypothetical protein
MTTLVEQIFEAFDYSVMLETIAEELHYTNIY